MARLIEKKKGYNTYLQRVVFAGYGLNISMRVEVPDTVVDWTPVRVSLDQKPLRILAPGVKLPPLFFEWFYVKQFHEKPFEDAVRLIRRLAEMCVEADFELLEKAMVRLKLNGSDVIRIEGNISVRAGRVRRVKKV